MIGFSIGSEIIPIAAVGGNSDSRPVRIPIAGLAIAFIIHSLDLLVQSLDLSDCACDALTDSLRYETFAIDELLSSNTFSMAVIENENCTTIC